MVIENKIDTRRRLLIPGDFPETLAFTASHLIEKGNEAIQKRDAFFIALSGGSTPKALYQALSSPPYNKELDWSKVWLFWGDERAVSPSDPMSNFRMAMDAGLSSLAIPDAQIFRMEGEGNLEISAQRYEEAIKKYLPDCSFDLILLGMGEDGHTASLFPGTKALEEKERLIVPNQITEDTIAEGSWRLTFTFPLIGKAEEILIYVVGASKKTMLKKVLNDAPTHYPISYVGTARNPALWVADKEAASPFLS